MVTDWATMGKNVDKRKGLRTRRRPCSLLSVKCDTTAFPRGSVAMLEQDLPIS
jgi:hypothetical protein